MPRRCAGSFALARGGGGDRGVGRSRTRSIRCRRCGTVFADVQWHGERCRCCGADLWGASVEKSIRKKWIRATDAERVAGLIG